MVHVITVAFVFCCIPVMYDFVDMHATSAVFVLPCETKGFYSTRKSQYCWYAVHVDLEMIFTSGYVI